MILHKFMDRCTTVALTCRKALLSHPPSLSQSYTSTLMLLCRETSGLSEIPLRKINQNHRFTIFLFIELATGLWNAQVLSKEREALDKLKKFLHLLSKTTVW